MLEVISPIDWTLLSGLTLVVIVLLYYYFGVFGKFTFYKPQVSKQATLEPVSIIIAARNELENLQNYLVSVLEQDYPTYEVIVVNHCSWDGSQAYLEDLQKTYPHLRISQLIEQEKYPTGKKFALTIGIKAAKYDLLLFTDADCEPSTNQWLKTMQSSFVHGKEIVLGFSPYRKRKGFLNLFIRFESTMTAVFYFGMALLNNPFMGVGRNMGYRKDLFFKYKGFASHQHLISGDDDLFVNETATSSNVAVEFHPSTFVYSNPKTNFSEYNRQKVRHMFVGKFYKSKHKRVLGTYYAAMMLFYALLAATLLCNIYSWPIVVGIFGVKFISQTIVFYMAGKKLQYKDLVFWLLLLDVMYVLFLIIYGTRGFFKRNLKHW